MELFRTSGVLDLDVVRRGKLVFLGLGSLGSLTVGNLAYPWREVVLIDPETLAEDNLERHLLGRSALGRPKVDGVADWLIDRGFDRSQVVTHQGTEVYLDRHTDADLVVVAIDKRQSCDNINAWCHAHGIPALYGGIYPQGTAGEVIAIPNSRVACYLCAAQMMGRGYQGHVGADYGVDLATLAAEDIHAVPALRWAINSIASDIAGLALEILQGGEVQPQILVHAHQWEPILNVPSGNELKALAAFISSQGDLGLIPNVELGKLEGGYELRIRRTVVSLALRQWDECPLHAGQVSIEDI